MPSNELLGTSAAFCLLGMIRFRSRADRHFELTSFAEDSAFGNSQQTWFLLETTRASLRFLIHPMLPDIEHTAYVSWDSKI